jgi:hypothetical protein
VKEKGIDYVGDVCHTWNPKAPGMTGKEFIPHREKWMKDLMAKKVSVRSMHSVFNWEQGKAWRLGNTHDREIGRHNS